MYCNEVHPDTQLPALPFSQRFETKVTLMAHSTLKEIAWEAKSHLERDVRVSYSDGIFVLEIEVFHEWEKVLILEPNETFPIEHHGRCWSWLPMSRFELSERLLAIHQL